MAHIDIDIDDYIDEISTSALIKELSDRVSWLSPKDKETFNKEFKEMLIKSGNPTVATETVNFQASKLVDAMKVEVFVKNISLFTLEELEEFIKTKGGFV